MSPSKLHCMEGERSVEYLPFKNGDVGLHAVAAGPEAGPVVVLLHGFPEFWYSWPRQIEPLSAAGFRVIVPDQRGYNLSSKPVGVSSYAVPELVSDVIEAYESCSYLHLTLDSSSPKTVFICSEMDGDSVRCWAARRSCFVTISANHSFRVQSRGCVQPSKPTCRVGATSKIVVPRCANEWSPVPGAVAWSIEFSNTGFWGIALPGLHCGSGASPGAPRARAQ
jgi:hypothetical protein